MEKKVAKEKGKYKFKPVDDGATDDFTNDLKEKIMILKQQDKFRNDYLSFNLHEMDIRKDERNLTKIESAKKWLLSQIVPVEKIAEIEEIPINVVLQLKSSLGL